MTDTVTLSQLPSGQSIKPASGTLTLDGTIIGSTNKQAGTFTAVSADSVTSPAGNFAIVSASTPITGSSGGTGNGFMTFAGPATALKTYTLPNASSTILTNNSAVTVVQGGTGLATLTANNVILGNGTSNPTFVAPSTSGNVLTSNGTTWQSQAAGASSGAWVNLNVQNASNSATIDFSSTYITSTYTNYYISIEDLISATDAVTLYMRFSFAGTFQTAGYNYTSFELSTTTAATAGNQAQILLSSASISNSSGANDSGANFQIRLVNVTNARPTMGNAMGQLQPSTSSYRQYVGGFNLRGTTAVDGVRFLLSSGNITSGKFTLWGIK